MATITIGTALTTTLIGMAFQPAFNAGALGQVMGTPVTGGPFTQADLAQIDSAILDDLNPARTIPPNYGATAGLTRGLLFVPNRGYLQIRPGDYVAYDAATGWPILISGRAAAGAGWVHT
jgi:hypothetical protein